MTSFHQSSYVALPAERRALYIEARDKCSRAHSSSEHSDVCRISRKSVQQKHRFVSAFKCKWFWCHNFHAHNPFLHIQFSFPQFCEKQTPSLNKYDIKSDLIQTLPYTIYASEIVNTKTRLPAQRLCGEESDHFAFCFPKSCSAPPEIAPDKPALLLV